MKGVMKFLALAVLVAPLATSCCKGDIDNLQKQIDDIKGGQIATLESQVSAINVTVGQLQMTQTQIQGYISELQKDGQTYRTQIAELQNVDAGLSGRITELKNYTDTGIADVGTWAEGTFATLGQMDSLCRVVVAILLKSSEIYPQLDSVEKQLTEGYVRAIKEAVEASATSMKQWVSEQFSDYYTIARIDATLDSLSRAHDMADATLSAGIEKQKAAMESAKSEITSAYKAAIKTACDDLDGKLNTKIAGDIATAKAALQSKIDEINGDIKNIKSRLDEAEKNIAALINQIQSIVVIPSYADGSVKVTGKTDIISFDIYPLSAADSLAKVWNAAGAEDRAKLVSFKIKGMQTKGASALSATISSVSFSDGEVNVGVTFENLPDNAMASLHIAGGKSDVSSGYFGLYCASEPIQEGALSGLFSVSATTKVRFSKGNLRYTVATTKWNFYDHQYDCASDYESSVISLFTWGYGDWSMTPDTESYGTTFTDWGTKIGDGNIWRTLTNDEWKYLVSAAPSGRGAGDTFFKCGVEVCGKKKCLVIAPDGNTTVIETSYDAVGWSTAEANGFVCLPAAGYRTDSYVVWVGDYGSYWSSTPGDDESCAYSFNFLDSAVDPAFCDGSCYGYSVRMVCSPQ